ncbi:hypothetical protein PTTG_07817 [Puccinia triticina 1-1 BBBD Race 1]|uniref:Uncharacterized protein n=2 Tax=Puccinia triticina TaxID=208348 RepID=A0A180GFC5_PUCT1|nr:uncharacterized protein PtA15_15A210 [Puccinia triticina]OAV91032.1 hypothetical protein PTTG_07817 [Puccinia triticina 1-1 BBBD Race 1]WAQ91818.1 hypothetical protein PtA15_15A210 [Puccinia triticina]WAR62613.1 hypothetical protein PtB15_15B199 [Puccinia triticina]
MEPAASKPDHPLSDDQTESDWTKLSIPDIQTSSAIARSTRPNTRRPHAAGSLPRSATIKRPDPDALPTSQILLPEHSNQYLGESDSSTNFDPQAWKRGDQGVGRVKTRPNIGAAAPKSGPEQQQQHNTNSSNRSVSSSSFFLEAAFIAPHIVSSTAARPIQTTQRRRAISNSRRASRPSESPSTSRPSGHHQPPTRPSSDLGPASNLSATRGVSSSPPTWRAYTGRESSSSTTTRTGDQKQEFLQAISNLQAMAKRGQFEWLSASSGNDDDQDADEPRPGHADLPTSTFNSAVGDDDDEGLLVPPPSNPQPDEPHTPWWSLIGRAISLKTWQFVGLGGIIFGFGICAGSFIGRNLSPKNSPIVKFFNLLSLS